jgi:hypothetical protein
MTTYPVLFGAALLSLSLALSAPAADFMVSSLIGGVGDDEVTGVKILADGSLVVAVNMDGEVPGYTQKPKALAGTFSKARGTLVFVSPDGTKVTAVVKVGDLVRDLASDAQDNLYLALGPDGMLKTDSKASKVIWKEKFKKASGHVERVDAGPDGTCAALEVTAVDESKPGEGCLHILDARGKALGSFAGRHNTLDVALHAESKTVCSIGWRQTRCNDGQKSEPVQISYLRGQGYDGTVKWSGYDWSTDADSDRFLNRPESNMADTRGCRVSLGRDGKLYGAFECAGGNHIFRFSPLNVSQKVTLAGGDKYHVFFNTASEHKTFFGRYDPATGQFISGQNFCARLAGKGDRGNAVRVEGGAIAGDEHGRPLVGGSSAYGLPLNLMPPDTGDYTGGSYLLVMSPDFKNRILCTRLQEGGQTTCIDTRTVDGRTLIAFGGIASAEKAFHKVNSLNAAPKGKDGFFALIGGSKR